MIRLLALSLVLSSTILESWQRCSNQTRSRSKAARGLAGSTCRPVLLEKRHCVRDCKPPERRRPAAGSLHPERTDHSKCSNLRFRSRSIDPKDRYPSSSIHLKSEVDSSPDRSRLLENIVLPVVRPLLKA